MIPSKPYSIKFNLNGEVQEASQFRIASPSVADPELLGVRIAPSKES